MQIELFRFNPLDLLSGTFLAPTESCTTYRELHNLVALQCFHTWQTQMNIEILLKMQNHHMSSTIKDAESSHEFYY